MIIHDIHLFSGSVDPLVGNVLREHYILKPEEVALAHQCPQILVDQVQIVLGFDYSVHVDVGCHIKAIVEILLHKRQNQLEQLCSYIQLDLEHSGPLLRSLKLQSLHRWQRQLLGEQPKTKGLHIYLVEELHNLLEDITDPWKNFVFATDVRSSGNELGAKHISLINLEVDLVNSEPKVMMVAAIVRVIVALLDYSGLLQHLNCNLFLAVEDQLLLPVVEYFLKLLAVQVLLGLLQNVIYVVKLLLRVSARKRCV